MRPEFNPGGFSFNQHLLVDEKPLLFHTGPGTRNARGHAWKRLGGRWSSSPAQAGTISAYTLSPCQVLLERRHAFVLPR
jgi:hypothetical protein